MLEHTQYEHGPLHQAFEQYLTWEFQFERYTSDRMQSMEDFFSQMHDAYMETEPTVYCDVQYICRVCAMICARILEKEAVPYMRGAKEEERCVQI